MIHIPLSDSEPVEYLTRRKFPQYPHVEALHDFPQFSSASSGDMSRENRKNVIKDIESYKSELRAKPPEELRALYRQEQEKERQERETKAERDEQQRFFNLPNAKADFTHWSKAAHWTLDEAVALSFGKAPEVVKWEHVKEFIHISRFAGKYGRVRDLTLRAKKWKQLYDPVLPGIFLAWARRMEVEVPSELVVQVEARGIVIADWKDMFDKLKEQYDEYRAAAETLFTANEEKIAELSQECDAMHLDARQRESRISGLEEAAWEFDPDSDTYPCELDIALLAWRTATNQRDSSKTAKEQIHEWLETYYRDLSKEAKERIAVVCNWEKGGGRRRRE